MLSPKKTKHRKAHKSARGGKAVRRANISFGKFGLKSMDAHWITARQIEAARRVMTRHVQRGGKMWIRIFPDIPVTAKGGEVRMGNGKGSVDHYIAVVKPGMMMFEMDGVARDIAKKAMDMAAYKLPIKCKFVEKSII